VTVIVLVPIPVISKQPKRGVPFVFSSIRSEWFISVPGKLLPVLMQTPVKIAPAGITPLSMVSPAE
jgi:hypothetical protein